MTPTQAHQLTLVVQINDALKSHVQILEQFVHASMPQGFTDREFAHLLTDIDATLITAMQIHDLLVSFVTED